MFAVAQEKLYTLFAALLGYPNAGTLDTAAKCVSALRARPEYPKEAADEVEAFLNEVKDMPLVDLEGVYSYTYEISSGEYTLDMGYHLFDGFKRANALVALKETYKRFGFNYDEVAKGELPDHLPVLLKFMDFANDQAVVSDMRESFLIKALEPLAKNFEKKTDTPYHHLVRAILKVVDTDLKVNGAEKKPSGKA